MATIGQERNQPVLLPTAEPAAEPDARPAPRPEPRFGQAAVVFALVMGAFWIGAAAAWLWGYFGPKGLAGLDLQEIALFIAATFIPAMLMIAAAWAIARAQQMAHAAIIVSEAADRMFAADETASRTAARLGRAVRRELDAMNSGLDGAFARLRALEGVLEKQIAALDEAGARADVRSEAVTSRLTAEREKIETAAGALGDSAARASETVAARLTAERERIEASVGTLGDAATRASDAVAARLTTERERIEASVASHGESAARASETVAAHLNAERERIEASVGSLGDAATRASDAVAARLAAERERTEASVNALGDAATRASEAGSSRLTAERERIEVLAGLLVDTATRASETVAGRAAQLKSFIESAETALKNAGDTLETQAASFRASATAAADAPHAAAVELDRQAKQIEAVSNAAMARAEFVLGRHERHRTGMNELMQRLKDESAQFELALAKERSAMEQAIQTLGAEAQKFETVTGSTERHLELIMNNAAARASQLTTNFMREGEKLKETSDAANSTLAAMINALKEANTGAQMLIGETTSEAKTNARALVGEAMAECDRLLRTAGELSAQATEIRTTLNKTVEDVQKHLLALPSIAQQESQRVRKMVHTETEHILDLSARTLSTIHARTAGRAAPRKPEDPPAPEPPEPEGLLGMAKRLTQRPRKPRPESTPAPNEPGKPWEMKKLLAAVETGERRDLKPSSAAALGALEAALADMAVDLDGITGSFSSGEGEWKKYLAGDRGVFARRLAGHIDDDTVNRIATLYREHPHFRDAANTYITEFESLLAKAKEGDGGGILTSTMLSADTGKIYLAVAYALGRL